MTTITAQLSGKAFNYPEIAALPIATFSTTLHERVTELALPYMFLRGEGHQPSSMVCVGAACRGPVNRRLLFHPRIPLFVAAAFLTAKIEKVLDGIDIGYSEIGVNLQVALGVKVDGKCFGILRWIPRFLFSQGIPEKLVANFTSIDQVNRCAQRHPFDKRIGVHWSVVATVVKIVMRDL